MAEKNVRPYSQVALANGLTGVQVARVILNRNALMDIPVQRAQSGPLSDY